jgi:predicted transcriptional regulator
MVESDQEDRSRIDRLRNEVERLRTQVAEIQIQRMQSKITTLRNQLAEVQSLRQAQDGVIKYLASQPGTVEEDRIQVGVHARRATLQKALRQLVEGGKVKRTGTGKRGDAYRYQISGTPVPNIDRVPENPNPTNDGSDEPQSANAGTGCFDR